MPQFQEYRAMNYFHGNPNGIVSLVAVHPTDPTRLHWNGGQSFTVGTEGKHYATLKVYKLADFMRELGEDEDEFDVQSEAEDAIEKLYFKEFHCPLASEVRQSAAWIAPDGKFYPC